MEHALYLIALVTVCALGTAAVLCRKYDDNIVQRTGIAMTCLAAVGRLFELDMMPEQNNHVRYLMVYGVAVYCVGTAYKVWSRE